MRYTKKVSVWPVAFTGGLLYQAPVCENEKVTGWFNVWGDWRPFRIDMAGFAINLNLILSKPLVRFSQQQRPGMQESYILRQLVRINDLEPKANSCTDIYAWHTKTSDVLRVHENGLQKKNLTYDLQILEKV